MRRASRLAIRLGIAGALAAAIGCEPAPTELQLTEAGITVHAVLVAGEESATVLLSRALPGGVPGTSLVVDGVAGATVRLVHGGDTLRLGGSAPCLAAPGLGGEVRPSPGCYAGSVPGGIQAGGEYELLIDVAGAPPIRGRTRVPRPPVVAAPAAFSELRYSPPPRPAEAAPATTVRWTTPEPARRAEVQIAARRSDCRVSVAVPNQFFGSGWIAVVDADSTPLLPWHVDCALPAPLHHEAWIVVTVFDDQYSRYIEARQRGTTLMLPDGSEGITGALGVFGSAGSARLPVILVQR